MMRLPTSTLLLVTAGAALSLTFACSGGGDSNDNTGGTSSTATGGTGNTPGAGTGSGGTNAGSAGLPGAGGSTGGTGGSTGGTGGTPPVTGGSAGVATMGGSGGTGGTGVAGMGGTGVSGSAGTGMAGTGVTAGTGSSGGCTITPMATASMQIGTVFNVQFTTDMQGVTEAHIDFGPDTNYGFTAPVDLKAANYKTPLLGMKQNKPYHYRVTVTGGSGMCSSADQPIMTGALLNGLPKATITTPVPDKLTGGFMVSEFYGGSKKVAFILDKDLETVWAYDPKFGSGGDITRARMSYDGKWMWIAHGNVPSSMGLMKKVAIDGSSEMDVSSKFVGLNHDFTVLPDETIYFIAYGAGGAQCDDIVEYKPDGTTRTVMNMSKAFSSGACHCNAIQYSKDDDTLVVSELDHMAYVKLDRMSGSVKWVLGGGSNNQFTGDGSTWTNEHNMHMLAKDHMVFFNNGPGMGQGSVAIELQLDETAKTAKKLWSYTAMPAIANAIMGDVQRMDNGNTIVAFSTQGVVHEVDAAGTVLQTISWGTGGAIGYIIKRPTLYGPPPR
jgi:hypothetical protein